jgi:hypothetical protein
MEPPAKPHKTMGTSRAAERAGRNAGEGTEIQEEQGGNQPASRNAYEDAAMY